MNLKEALDRIETGVMGGGTDRIGNDLIGHILLGRLESPDTSAQLAGFFNADKSAGFFLHLGNEFLRPDNLSLSDISLQGILGQFHQGRELFHNNTGITHHPVEVPGDIAAGLVLYQFSLSRSQLFELKALSEEEILKLLNNAISDQERGLGKMNLEVKEEALRHIARFSDGDARKALNSIEVAALTPSPDPDGVIRITLAVAEESIQHKAVIYDADGDAHFDTISAFIKSMRGSDPDAALYWLAKMIHAGEDPRFIARRIVICAAEDVGLADPMALVLANSAAEAAEFIGWPEARIPIAEAAVYVATAHKSNSVIKAIDAALKDVRSGVSLPVPQKLKDSHYSGADKLGHGLDYLYPHDFPGHFVPQDYLGRDCVYYIPTEQGVEKKIKERSQAWRDAILKMRKT
jgi:putative ATPase